MTNFYCSACQELIDTEFSKQWFTIDRYPLDEVHHLCNIDCGLTLLWKWKESQPKLSKSRLSGQDDKNE